MWLINKLKSLFQQYDVYIDSKGREWGYDGDGQYWYSNFDHRWTTCEQEELGWWSTNHPYGPYYQTAYESMNNYL